MKYLRSLVFMMIAICVMLCLSNSTDAIVVDRRTVKLEIVNAENIDDLRVYQLLPTEYVEYVMSWNDEYLKKQQEYYEESPLRHIKERFTVEQIQNELDKGNYIKVIELGKQSNGGNGIFIAEFGNIKGLENDYYTYKNKKYIQTLVNPQKYGVGNETVIISEMGSVIIPPYDKLDFKYLIKSVNDEDIIIDLESYQYSEAPYGGNNYELSLRYDYKNNEIQVVTDSAKKNSNDVVIAISIMVMPLVIITLIIVASKRRK